MAKAVKKVVAPKAKPAPKLPPMSVSLVRTQAHFYDDKLPKKREFKELGLGRYFILFAVTAGHEVLHIPISIGTGKKFGGFLYHIEGSGVPKTTTADLEVKKGEGITTVVSGSVVYAKIPSGKTATVRINAEVVGDVGRAYAVTVSQISYKTTPHDYRYKKFATRIASDMLEFRTPRR